MNAEVKEAIAYLKSRRGPHDNPATFGYMLAVIGDHLADEAERNVSVELSPADVSDGAQTLMGGLRDWLVSKDHLPYAFWLGKDGHA